MPTWTTLGTKIPVQFYDVANPSNKVIPQINPASAVVKVSNVRKYMKTTNGTSVIMGDKEYPPQEIVLSWPMLDDADLQALSTMQSIYPLVYVDQNDKGFLGALAFGDVEQIPNKSSKIFRVSASFLITAPYNGNIAPPLTQITPPILTPTWSTTGGYVPSGGTGFIWTTATTPFGESVVGAPLSVVNGVSNPTAAPVLSYSAGGTLGATTYFAKYTYITSSGESMPSPEASISVPANNVLTIAAPPSPAISGSGYTYSGYLPYVSTTTGTETKQTSTTQTGTWTEPVGGLISGAAVPTSNNTGSNTASLNVVFSHPASTYYRKTRLYWSTVNSSAGATFLTDCPVYQTASFKLVSPYFAYSTKNPPTYGTAFTGMFAAGRFLSLP